MPPQNATPYCRVCHSALSSTASVGSKNGYCLLKCGSCASVTVDPFPTVDTLKEFYQSYKGTADYRAKEAKKISRAKKRIARLVKLTSGKSFLDVGCNYGFAVKAAADIGLEAKGIDIDEAAIAEKPKSVPMSIFRQNFD